MGLSMIFKGCLEGLAVPLAKFEPFEKGPYQSRKRLVSESDARAMLTRSDFDFPDDVFISEHQLIRALGAMKELSIRMRHPRLEWHG